MQLENLNTYLWAKGASPQEIEAAAKAVKGMKPGEAKAIPAVGGYVIANMTNHGLAMGGRKV